MCTFDISAFDVAAFDVCVPVAAVEDNCEYDAELSGLGHSGVPVLVPFSEEKLVHWRAGENNLDNPIKIPFGW